MSKLAIVFCAVLFASAAHAVSWTDSLKAVQKSVEHVIETAISKVEEEYLDTQLKTLTAAAELSQGTSDFADKIWDEVAGVTDNVTAEINELTSRVKGVNIDECIKLSDNLSKVAQSGITTASSCVNNKLKSGYGYIETINKVSHEVLAEVSEIREQPQRCGDNIDSAKSAAAAIFCAKTAAATATWISVKAAPKLTAGWTKLQFLLVTLQRYLAGCETNKALETFYQESSTIVQRTEQCILEKINEPQDTTEPATIPTEPTTPKVHESSEENIIPAIEFGNEYLQ